MFMGNILLKNILLKGETTDILISDGKIKTIGKSIEALKNPKFASGVEVVDCTNKAAVPGFVNMHTHAAMTLMRGAQEDVQYLQDWLQKIWEMETKIDGEFVYWGTKVACLEMIKTGTTTFNDQYWYCEAAHEAAYEMGIRPVISYVVLDHGDKEEAERQKEQCIKKYKRAKKWKGTGQFEMAFHSIYSVSEEMMLWASDFARKHDLKLHIHLAETLKEDQDCKVAHGGLSPTEYLDRLGILDENVIAAHSLWLSENDIKILGERKVNCVHNINSNTKLASGYKFLYDELRAAGANICLGTDGCASSNNLDMLEAMKTSAIIQKAWRKNPMSMPMNELMDMATYNGAKALGLNTGKIEEGRCADILIVDTNNTFFLSPGTFEANLIYSAHSDCINSVIANGHFVMRNRVVAEEQKIIDNARIQVQKLL